MKGFLEIERQNEIMQKQEIEMAQTSKQNREKVSFSNIFGFILYVTESIFKLLAVLSEQQLQFDFELNKIQQIKDTERFRLIEQLQEGNFIVILCRIIGLK